MIRLLTLGGLEVVAADGTVVRSVLAQPKRAALLAYLAFREPVAFHSRNHLASTFWPESDDTRARGALRTAIHFLRNSLGADVLLTRGDDEVGLNPEVIECDAVAMQHAFEDGRLEEGLALWRGEFLQGVLLPDADTFNDWVDLRRRQLRRHAIDAARALTERGVTAGQHADAVRWARRWVELAPFEESAARVLMQAQIAAGERAGALEEFQKWRAHLRREIGAEPAAETLALAAGLREPAPAVPALKRTDPAISIEPAPPAPEPAAMAAAPDRPKHRIAWLATALAVAAIVAVVLWPRSADPTVTDAVAVVLPFSYGGNPELAYLRNGMVDLLSTELNESGVVRTVDPRAVLAHIKDGRAASPADARAIARRFAARYYVLGSIVELRGRVQLNAALYRSTSDNVVKQVSLAAPVDSLFDLVDQASDALLSSEIQRGVGINARGEGVRTRSMAALGEFVTGEQEFARSRWDEAAAAYARAIALDSTFARAHMRAATVAHWQGVTHVMEKSLAAALRYQRNLSPDDRLLLRGFQAHLGGRPFLAESLYVAFLQHHPENAEPWVQLGEVRFHWGGQLGMPAASAEAAFARALDLLPDQASIITHLIRLAARRGDAPAIDSLTARLLALRPRDQESFEARAFRAIAHRDSQQMAVLRAEAAQMDYGSRVAVFDIVSANADLPLLAEAIFPVPGDMPFRHWRSRLAHGQFARAEALMRGARAEPWRAAEYLAVQTVLPFREVGAAKAAEIERTLIGRSRPPRRAAWQGPANEDWDGDVPPLREYLLLGLLRLQQQDTAAVMRYTQLLDAYPADTTTVPRRYLSQYREYARENAGILRAMLHHNDAGRVLRELGPPRPDPHGYWANGLLYASAMSRWLRAEALLSLGRHEEALQWFGTFPDNSGYDVAYIGFARLHAAEIHQRLGDHEKMREAATHAVRLWQDADPELQALKQAALSKNSTR